MRGGLHRSDESGTGEIATEATKFLGCNDDDLIPSMHRDVLRAFIADTSNQFAEARLRVLKRPVSGPWRPTPAGKPPRRRWFCHSGHTD